MSIRNVFIGFFIFFVRISSFAIEKEMNFDFRDMIKVHSLNEGSYYIVNGAGILGDTFEIINPNYDYPLSIQKQGNPTLEILGNYWLKKLIFIPTTTGTYGIFHNSTLLTNLYVNENKKIKAEIISNPKTCINDTIKVKYNLIGSYPSTFNPVLLSRKLDGTILKLNTFKISNNILGFLPTVLGFDLKNLIVQDISDYSTLSDSLLGNGGVVLPNNWNYVNFELSKPFFYGGSCFNESMIYELKSFNVQSIVGLTWYNNKIETKATSYYHFWKIDSLKYGDTLQVKVKYVATCNLRIFESFTEKLIVGGIIPIKSTLSISGFYNFCNQKIELLAESNQTYLNGYKMKWKINNEVIDEDLTKLNYDFKAKSMQTFSITGFMSDIFSSSCIDKDSAVSNTILISTFPAEEDCPFAILTSIGNTLKVVKRDGSPYLGNYKLYKDTTFVADFTGQIATSVSGSYFIEYLDCICEATLLRSDAYSFTYNPLITNSIDQNNQNEIEIYPNPSQGFLYIKNAEMVKVYDLLGNFVTQSENETLVLASKGIYLAEIITKFGKKYQKLIVK